jgi:predicted amidohydrolase
MRIALAQINPSVGDLEGNAALIRSRVAEAAAAGAFYFLIGSPWQY